MVKTRGTPVKVVQEDAELEEDDDMSSHLPETSDAEEELDTTTGSDAEMESAVPENDSTVADSVNCSSLPLDCAAKDFYQQLFTEHEVAGLKSPAGRSIKKYAAKCGKCERKVTSTDSFYGFRAHYQTKHPEMLAPAGNGSSKKRFRDATEISTVDMVPLEVPFSDPVESLPWDRSGKEFFQQLFVNHKVGKEQRRSDSRMGTRYLADCKLCGKQMMGLDGFFKFREHYKLRHSSEHINFLSNLKGEVAGEEESGETGQLSTAPDRPAKEFFYMFFTNHSSAREDTGKETGRKSCVRIFGDCRLCEKKVQCTDTYHGFRAHIQHKHKDSTGQATLIPLSEFITFPNAMTEAQLVMPTTSVDVPFVSETSEANVATYVPRDKSAKLIYEQLYTGHEVEDAVSKNGKERKKSTANCRKCGKLVTGNSSYHNFKTHAIDCQKDAALALISTHSSSTVPVVHVGTPMSRLRKHKEATVADGSSYAVTGGHPNQQKLIKNVTVCSAETLIPLDALTNRCFDRLVKDMDSRLTWPSLAVLSNKYIPDLRTFVKNSITRDLVTVPAVAVTVNIWSLQPNSYFSVLVHYVDDMWRIRSPVVAFKQSISQPSAKALCESVVASLKEFSITDQVVYVDVNDGIPFRGSDGEADGGNGAMGDSVHDKFAGARMGKVVKELKRLLLDQLEIVECKIQLRCVVRTLEVILEEAVKESKEASALLKKIVNMPVVWKKTGNAGTGATAWESIVHKMQSASDFNWDAAKTKNKLSDEEQSILADFLKVADGFEEFFQKMSQPDLPTVCDLIPFVYGLRQHLTTCAAEADNLQQFPQSILEHLDTQFEGVDEEDLYVIASFINPNYKLDWCKASPTDLKKEFVHRLILEKMSELNQEGEAAEAMPEPQEPSPKRRSTLLSFMGDPPASKPQSSNGAPSTGLSAEDELNQYLREDLTDENPLAYWKRNKDRFKRLSRLAESVLFVPSVPTKVKLFQNVLGAQKASSQYGGQLDSVLFCHLNPEVAAGFVVGDVV